MTDIKEALAGIEWPDEDPWDAQPRMEEIQLPPGFQLIQTCSVCPEQYDIKDAQGAQWAYLRLRHGTFSVTVPDVGGQQLVKWRPQGDGIFHDSERSYWLNRAIHLCIAHYELPDPTVLDELNSRDFNLLVAELLERLEPPSGNLRDAVAAAVARLRRPG